MTPRDEQVRKIGALIGMLTAGASMSGAPASADTNAPDQPQAKSSPAELPPTLRDDIAMGLSLALADGEALDAATLREAAAWAADVGDIPWEAVNETVERWRASAQAGNGEFGTMELAPGLEFDLIEQDFVTRFEEMPPEVMETFREFLLEDEGGEA